MRRWLAAAVTLIVFGAAGLAVAFWPEDTEKAARPLSALGQASDEGGFDTLEIVAKGTTTILIRHGRGDATGFVASAGANAGRPTGRARAPRSQRWSSWTGWRA